MDFTGDGIADILSGCYWSNDPDCPEGNPQAGYIYVLAGTKDGGFLKAKPVLTAEKKPLTNIPLSREKLEDYGTDDIEWGNICTAQFAVDYDADGDLDLVVGEMGSKFYLHLNSAESSKVAPVFADKPQVLKVELPEAHSDPYFVDWDADGDLDLLSGSSSGSVYLSINKGTAASPKWADFECLIQNEMKWSQTTDDGKNLEPGHGSRICITDFNRDGRLDVLLGDATTVENKIPGLSASEADRMEQEYNDEMKPIQEAMREIYEKAEKDYEKAKAEGDDDAATKLREKVEEQTKDLRGEMMSLRKKEKLFQDHESTGHVWVYLQK